MVHEVTSFYVPSTARLAVKCSSKIPLNSTQIQIHIPTMNWTMIELRILILNGDCGNNVQFGHAA